MFCAIPLGTRERVAEALSVPRNPTGSLWIASTGTTLPLDANAGVNAANAAAYLFARPNRVNINNGVNNYGLRTPQYRTGEKTQFAGIVYTQVITSPEIVPGRLLISTKKKPSRVRTSKSTSFIEPSSATNSKFDQAR